MSAYGERSSRNYAREAEVTRRRISRTMDEVTDRLFAGSAAERSPRWCRLPRRKLPRIGRAGRIHSAVALFR